MFDHVANEYNPQPRLVVDPTPLPGRLVAHLPWSEAIVVDLPPTVEALHARQPGRFWSEQRRRRRRFEELHGPLSHRRVTATADLATVLPQVRAVYAARWADEYTSLDWKTEAGFAPYAEAMRHLTARGRGRLDVLEADGRVLAFTYSLLQDRWCAVYQHAVVPDEELRRFGLGKLLVSALLEDLVADPEIDHVDWMLGDAAYKREWESWRRTVYLRLDEPATLAGRLRLAVRAGAHRLRLRVQFGSPRLRRVLKRALARVPRLVPAGG